MAETDIIDDLIEDDDPLPPTEKAVVMSEAYHKARRNDATKPGE